MPSIDPARSAFLDARRWGAHALFQCASWTLRGSINLYERHTMPPIVLHAALATVRVLERSARMLLFGYRSHSGHKYPNRSHRR
jgi:hypothetical protein